MKSRVKGSDQDVTYGYHICHTNLFPNSIKHHINPLIQFLYTTHSVWESNMKISELVAWNCKSFTYGFIGFKPTDHRDNKLKNKT